MVAGNDLREDLLRAFRWVDGHADVWRFFLDGELFARIAGALAEPFASDRPTKIAGVEARAFILGGAVAHRLGVGFLPIRKEGSLFAGRKVARQTGDDYRGRSHLLRMQTDAVAPGDRVLLIDDWIERGSQAIAAQELCEGQGARFLGVSVVVDELGDAEVRRRLGRVHSLVSGAELPPDH